MSWLIADIVPWRSKTPYYLWSPTLTLRALSLSLAIVWMCMRSEFLRNPSVAVMQLVSLVSWLVPWRLRLPPKKLKLTHHYSLWAVYWRPCFTSLQPLGCLLAPMLHITTASRLAPGAYAYSIGTLQCNKSSSCVGRVRLRLTLPGYSTLSPWLNWDWLQLHLLSLLRTWDLLPLVLRIVSWMLNLILYLKSKSQLCSSNN